MSETDQWRPSPEPEPSLDDLTPEEELSLFHEARELEGTVAMQARERLSELSWPIITRTARRYRRSLGEEAYEDLLQDQRLKVIDELIDRHDPEEGRFARYVAAYTKYGGLDAINKAKREVLILDDEGEIGPLKDRIADTGLNVEDQVVEGRPVDQIDVDPLLSILSEDEREVIELLIFDDADLTHQDVAQHLEVSTATVGYRKARALERLLDSTELSRMLDGLKDKAGYEAWVSTGLGKAIVERRQIRIARARERFLTERADRLARVEAEREASLRHRQEAIRKGAGKKAREIAERRMKYEEDQSRSKAEAIRKEAHLDARRKLILERLEEDRRERLPDLKEHLTAAEIRVLAYLHLPREEASKELGIRASAIAGRVLTAKRRLGLETTEALALWALEHGISYVVAEPPEMEEFTLRERMVASRLWRKNPDIAKELDINNKMVSRAVMSLLKKTGAKNRTELALIAQLYGFDPFPEELDDDTHEALKPFTEFQRAVLSRLHLSGDIIAGELGISRYGVAHALDRVKTQTGMPNRVALALKLLEDGYQFDINEPDRPLHELLTEQELAIAHSIDKPYEEIAREQGLKVDRVNQWVDYIRRKTGARSRVELALIARVFDTGKTKPIYHNLRPRTDRFFEALGIEPMPMEEARAMLEHVTPKQAEYIDAYYFSAEEVSWRAIAQKFFVRREAAMIMARRGIERIREKLEEQKAA